jgi:O-antigen ligase
MLRRPKMDWRTKLVVSMWYAYNFVGKPFVYLGAPFTFFLFLDPAIVCDRMYIALTRRGPLSAVCWTLLLSTLYGAAELVYGLLLGYDPITVLEVTAYSICPWYLFLGMWAGAARPDLVRNYIRFFAWYSAIYTPLYFLFLRHLSQTIPGTDIELFGQPGSGSLVILGLLCFEQRLARYWFPIAVCCFQTIASQIRADWLGLALVLVIWGFTTKQVTRLLSTAGALIVLLFVGYVTDVSIPALPGRGGAISARETISRAVAAIDPSLAEEYSKNTWYYSGTIYWRTEWWKEIRYLVFQKYSTTLFGLGYGYPLKNLVPYLKDVDVRSPHNIFYFTLAYSGLIGFVAFLSFQAALLALFWRVYRETGQLFGFVSLIFIVIGAFFGNFLESPPRVIPIYLMWGMCIGPLLRKREDQQAAFTNVRIPGNPLLGIGLLPMRNRDRRQVPFPKETY